MKPFSFSSNYVIFFYMNHEFDAEAISIAKKHRLFGIPVPVEYGGLGLRPIIHSLVQMRLGQLGLGFATLYDVQTFIAANIISWWGSEGQKLKHLKPIFAPSRILLPMPIKQLSPILHPCTIAECPIVTLFPITVGIRRAYGTEQSCAATCII